MPETVPLGGTEIVVLALGGVLLFVQFVLMAVPANRQPGGGSMGEGRSPWGTMRLRVRSVRGSGRGMAEIRACV